MASPLNLADELAKADEKTLREILRQAESYLSAQLTAGIAADQRAIAFSGVVAAAAAIIAGGGIALLQSDHSILLAWLGLSVSGGLLTAMFFAMRTAMPAGFWYVGNNPSEWVQDIQGGKTWEMSCAEQAAHYAEMIAENNAMMSRNGTRMRVAVWTCWATLVAGAVAVALSFSGITLKACALGV
jgi:hypothetical protein